MANRLRRGQLIEQIPTPVSPNLTLDVISLSDQINRGTRRDNHVTAEPTDAASLSSHKMEIVVPNINEFTFEERTYTLLRYVTIMCKSSLLGLNVNSAHIGSIVLFCGIDPSSDFFNFLGREGFSIEFVDCADFNAYLNSIDCNEAKELLLDLDEIDNDNKEKASRAYMGVIILLIGKKLTSSGWQKWGINALRALLGTIGEKECCCVELFK